MQDFSRIATKPNDRKITWASFGIVFGADILFAAERLLKIFFYCIIYGIVSGSVSQRPQVVRDGTAAHRDIQCWGGGQPVKWALMMCNPMCFLHKVHMYIISCFYNRMSHFLLFQLSLGGSKYVFFSDFNSCKNERRCVNVVWRHCRRELCLFAIKRKEI